MNAPPGIESAPGIVPRPGRDAAPPPPPPTPRCHDSNHGSARRGALALEGPDTFDGAASQQDELRLSAIAAVLGELSEGVVLLRAAGHRCYQNAAATQMLVRDAEREVLAFEIRTLARLALRQCGAGASGRELETATNSYRLRAKLLSQVIADLHGRTILVVIDRLNAPLPSAETLMQRFWLTPREAEVALLLAKGTRNADIARILDLSCNTARHYTETVLTKFAVHARADVARAILSLARRGPDSDRY